MDAPMTTPASPDKQQSDLISELKFDERGLIVAIAQDFISGDVRMVAWMNQASLEHTLSTGKATFFSRSRGKLWTKGETSGHFLQVKEVHADCDGDTLLLRVLPDGPSCHTGRPTCFFHRVGDTPASLSLAQPPHATFIDTLEDEIASRQSSTADKSYTKYLLDRGADKIGSKVTEEAGEFVQAMREESNERVASEAADVLYHLLVGLRLRGVSWRRVIEVLAERSKQSGHEEKASRQQ